MKWELCYADLVRAVNYMAMARGPAADYDHWAKITGDQSWEWNHVLPMMREVQAGTP